MPLFSKKEAFRFGWETFKAHWRFFVGLTFLVSLAAIIPSEISQSLMREVKTVVDGREQVQKLLTLPAFIFAVIAGYISFSVQLGAIKIALKFVDGGVLTFKEALRLFKFSPLLILKLCLASLVYGLIVFGGFLLLIVPGVIWGIKYRLYPFFLFERNCSAWESLKLSARATEGAKMKLFVFGLLAGGVLFLGGILLGVGLLAAIPITMLAYAFIYRRLEIHLRVKDSQDPMKQPVSFDQWKMG